MPAPTLGPDGVLYVAWADRPHGLGGGFGNAARIDLAYSRNGGRSWSRPQVISGRRSATQMADRRSARCCAPTTQTLERYRLLTYGQQIARAVSELERPELAVEVHRKLRHLIVKRRWPYPRQEHQAPSLIPAQDAKVSSPTHPVPFRHPDLVSATDPPPPPNRIEQLNAPDYPHCLPHVMCGGR